MLKFRMWRKDISCIMCTKTEFLLRNNSSVLTFQTNLAYNLFEWANRMAKTNKKNSFHSHKQIHIYNLQKEKW